ncbi:MAG: ribonuclease E inhibitor RraB [Cyclobacteriaceae bacterium]|nr:ribonuclease E inhibitor RraB [Cyclobacteriaceae bacterium]
MKSDLENIKAIFNKMSTDKWDINNDLTWGFFFVDKDYKKLSGVFEELKDKGYKKTKLDRGDDGLWTLQVSKRETLTPEKLHKRNLAFNDLADYWEINMYDGWDVEQ